MTLKQRYNESTSKLHQGIGKEEGKRVTGPLSDPSTLSINNTFDQGQYSAVIDQELLKRASDTTQGS
jgi:hypothetical protein